MNTYQAKRIPLTAILSRLGREPVREAHGELWYLSPFRLETTASFQVNPAKNIWHDFGEGGGGNVLDFAMKYFRVSTISDALRELEAFEGMRSEAVTSVSPARSSTSAPSAITVERVQPLQSKALMQYLEKRGIPVEIVRPYVQEMYYTRGDKLYFALAFPNQSGGYELRNAYFKGVVGSKDITLLPGPETASVRVFEGFMDYLSALVHYGSGGPQSAALVLNSVAMRDKAMAAIRQNGVTTVHLYLDHDEAGRALTAQFQERLTGITVVDESGLYEGYEDFNAMLQKQHERASH